MNRPSNSPHNRLHNRPHDNQRAPQRRRAVTALLAVLCLVLPLLLSACAAKTDHPLLKENPAAMTDAGLLRYYYDLGEAIQACEGTADDGPNVGVGGTTGSYGTGVGVVIGFPMGSGCDASALRDRRAQVGVLLNQRGLTP